MKYKIQVNSEVIDLEKGDVENLDFQKINDSKLHVLDGNKSFDVELLEADFQQKKMTVEVNGEKFELEISDEYDQLVTKMGLGAATGQKLKNIKAPMPGLVLDILVEAGQTIQKGDQLLILEAMKMENVLKAQGEGVVKSIEITKGQAVEKGQIMIEMES